MILPDVNLLLYAHVTSFPAHDAAREWWEDLLGGGGEEVGIAGVAAFGFVRIATSRRVLSAPMKVERALGYIEDWLAQPCARTLDTGPRHLPITFDLLRKVGTAGNLTTDAQIAALAVEHRAEVHTADADFTRFAGVRWRNPLVAGGRGRSR
jgi:toxin-antitoxin system PIN domain toxin